jgi:hypothetical protein
LDAIEDIHALEARYARYADHKRRADLADLFTEDDRVRPLDVEGNAMANMADRKDIATQLASRTSRDVQPIDPAAHGGDPADAFDVTVRHCQASRSPRRQVGPT